MNDYYVYLIASKRNGTLYTGVTNDLKRRMYEHKNGLVDGFSKKYNVHLLVYFNQTPSVESAIEREKQIKGWIRKKKINLIELKNPEWKDLSEDWF